MTRPNVVPLHPSDHRYVGDPVEYVELRPSRHVVIGAMPSARAAHASHRARAGLGHAVGVTIARVAEALASPRFILFYLGFYAGCMATVALAMVWVKVLS